MPREQNVYGASAAVDGPRGHECDDRLHAAQPLIDDALYHGSERTGAAALAMDHAHTAQAAGDGIGDEFA